MKQNISLSALVSVFVSQSVSLAHAYNWEYVSRAKTAALFCFVLFFSLKGRGRGGGHSRLQSPFFSVPCF